MVTARCVLYTAGQRSGGAGGGEVLKSKWDRCRVGWDGPPVWVGVSVHACGYVCERHFAHLRVAYVHPVLYCVYLCTCVCVSASVCVCTEVPMYLCIYLHVSFYSGLHISLRMSLRVGT